MTDLCLAGDNRIIAKNWKPCRNNSGDLPAWTKSKHLQDYYDRDSHYLAQWGLCNEKYHRVVICAGNYFEEPLSTSDKVCQAVYKGALPTGIYESQSTTLPSNSGRLKSSEYNSACPENLGDDENREIELKRFWKWIKGNYPKMTLREMGEFRLKFLKSNHCYKTLKNIKRNSKMMHE